MAVTNGWRSTVTMNDWMRDIEKRLMHEERRPLVDDPYDVVGPGISTYSQAVTDWNSDGPTVNGFFYSHGNQVVNSPDNTLEWMGLVEANEIGQGIQRIWNYLTVTTVAPSGDAGDVIVDTQASTAPVGYSRTFVTNDDGTRTYTAWTQEASGGTGTPGPPGPAGPTGQRGSWWWTGTGAPVEPITGSLAGDMYLNTTNGDVYRLDGP